MSLTRDELRHYQRQYQLSEFGVEGQLKLKRAKIAVVGAGGLGSPVLLYLASAGVGMIRIIDFDKVELHNLHRQVLYTYDDIGNQKAETSAKKLALHNPNICIEACTQNLNKLNAVGLLDNFDLIIDGTDNFETRYAVNDACLTLNRPFVSGAIYKFEGHVGVFNYKNGPSYRDLFPVQPASETMSCSTIGVMGSTCAVIGGLMANEAIKIISGLGVPLSGSILQINLLNMEMHRLKISLGKKFSEL